MGGTRRINVLVVDDSNLNLAMYRALLATIADVDVVAFASPQLALDWAAREGMPDIAIVDYHMPEIDGVTFVSRAKAQATDDRTFFVMITGDADARRTAFEGGVHDFLTKPIDRPEFLARMRNMTALAVSRRQLADRAEWLREEVERATSSVLSREIETIVRLTRLAEFRDDVTGTHVIRVGQMCAAVGRAMGLDEERCKMLLLAAPMHDIGKVAIEDGVLRKPGPLSADEFEKMKRHTIAGYEILKDSDSPMLRCAADIAVSHHERWDGLGYPYGLAGEAIPLGGRICSIVDVFDALTSERPYKEAWTIGRALKNLMDDAGKRFDPAVVAAFQDTLGELISIKRRFSETAPDIRELVRAFG